MDLVDESLKKTCMKIKGNREIQIYKYITDEQSIVINNKECDYEQWKSALGIFEVDHFWYNKKAAMLEWCIR